MKFMLGVAIGAIGTWAYRTGKLDSLMGNAPNSVSQAWQPAAERLGQVANSDQLRQVGAAVQDKMQQTRATDIVTPSAAEISGRPAEPLPRSGG